MNEKTNYALKCLSDEKRRMGEFWRVVKEHRQEKKANNYKSSRELLIENNVEFIEKPNGHFIIIGKDARPSHDFWATTGLIIERNTKRRSRGIRNLLRFIKAND